MKIIKAFKMACLGIWGNKFRVLMASFSVVISVFAVIVLSSIALGVKEMVMKQLDGLGADQILVLPGRVLKDDTGAHNFLNGMTNMPSTLTYADVEEIEKQDSVEEVTPLLETVGRIHYQGAEAEKGTSMDAMLVGTSESYQQVLHTEMAEGRFFTNDEGENREKVVVLGSGIHSALLKEDTQNSEVAPESAASQTEPAWWRKLFNWVIGERAEAAAGENSLVGQKVQIQGEEFTVVGVLASKATLGMTSDNSVLIPVQTALNVTTIENLTSIYVKADQIDHLDQVEKDVHRAVGVNHSETDFSTVRQTEVLDAVGKVTQILEVMIMGITAIALLISGAGIMNVMTMSVRERTREIGIRKALGASTLEILYQFFFETVILCVLGGAVGLLLGYAFVEWWNDYISIFSLVLPLWTIRLALISSLLIGCVCAIYPALKAAGLQPSRALRFE